ncbi:MAG: MBL fold metallo-hydrolase [Candidatus Thorarchaeota archaeon]
MKEQHMKILQLLDDSAITNSYLVFCEETKDALIIDPFFEASQGAYIVSDIMSRGLNLRYIINTHGHPDHVSGNRMIKRTTGAQILVHESDANEIVSPWQMLRAIAESPRECPDCGKTGKRTLEISEDERTAIMGCKFCGPKLNFETSPAADIVLSRLPWPW